MSNDTTVGEIINLPDLPGDVETTPARGKKGGRAPRGERKAAGAGTKLQTQVPREWRLRVATIAKERGVRESDVLREFIAKGLGV